MKSRISPGMLLFQVVVLDFNRRQSRQLNHYQESRAAKNPDDYAPQRTLFRWAKDGKRAMKWAKKFGSVISCRKVDSHIRRFEMIDHLNIELKPIAVDITADEFIVGRDLQIEPKISTKNIGVSNT